MRFKKSEIYAICSKKYDSITKEFQDKTNQFLGMSKF